MREGIKWSYVDFVDNQETLDLLEGGSGTAAALGVFPLIDEANRIARATHQVSLTFTTVLPRSISLPHFQQASTLGAACRTACNSTGSPLPRESRVDHLRFRSMICCNSLQDLAHTIRKRLAGQVGFTAPKRPPHSFGVDHYAGQV